MKKFKSIILLITLIIMSCTESNSITIILEDNTVNSTDYPNLTNPNYTGTICCIQRNSELNIDSLVEYEYFTNLSNPSVTWSVDTGDIEIVSGQNTNKATIKFGKNFQGGRIRITGTSGSTPNDLICGESILITASESQN